MTDAHMPTPGLWVVLSETWNGDDGPCTEVYAENGELICAARVKDAALIARAPAMASELAMLSDPDAVHLNMLRGSIAKPSPAQIGHLYRGEDAVEVVAEVCRQNPEAFAGDEIAALKARVAELEADDATPYREALGQIVQLLAEERALNGGGPNFRVRWTKALDEAEELMRIEP